MKKIISFIIFINLLFSIYGSSGNFIEGNGFDFGLFSTNTSGLFPNVEINIITGINNIKYSTNANLNYNYNYILSGYSQVFRFPKDNENYIFSTMPLWLEQDNQVYNFNFKKYNSESASNYICNPSIISFNSNFLVINSNLQPIKVYDYDNNYPYPWPLKTLDLSQLNLSDQQHFEDLFNKYYYPKTRVVAELYSSTSSTPITIFYPINNTQTYTAGTTTYNNFVHLKPGSNNIQFNLPNNDEIYATYGSGDYYWKFTVDPIDLKCDTDNNGILTDGSEKTSNSYQTLTFTVSPPPGPVITSFYADKELLSTYSDTTHLRWTTTNVGSCQLQKNGVTNIPDISYLGLTSGNIQATLNYNELTTSYTLVCSGTSGGTQETVNQTVTLKLDSDKDGYPDSTDTCANIWNPEQRSLIFDSTQNKCIPVDSDNDGVADFKPDGTPIDICPNTAGLIDYKGCQKYSVTCSGSSISGSDTPDSSGNFNFYCSGSSRLIAEDNNVKSPAARGNNLVWTVTKLGNVNYACYQDKGILGNSYLGDCTYTENPKLNITNTVDNSYTGNYIIGNQNYSFIEWKDNNGTTSTINLPTQNTTSNNYIYTYKDGVLKSKEKPDPYKIAMAAHKIKNLKSKSQAEKFINDTYRLMNKFNIIQNLTYDGTNTNVQIQLQNIPTSEQKNITIYQIISKSVANSAKDITFISDGGAERFIVDKDPIIGWYFNDSGSGSGINYQVPGNSNGSNVIVTQEPILFNEGELTINYRQTNCNAGEAQVFELDNLENSKVYTSGSGKLYKVCVSHITESLSTTKTNNYIHIANYTNADNISLNNLPQYLSSIDISTSNTNIVWDMKIQESNPSGNYSCLGSINNEDNSTSGDCGFNPQKRIWLHLGIDTVPPTSTVNIPYLAHTITTSLSAQDNVGGSGLKEIKYCYDSDNTCTPGVNGEKFGTTTTSPTPLTLTCSYTWGCIKYLRHQAIDNKNNIESIQSTTVKLIDKGSSCQSDCTAKPSPNRFLKECRNLNGCTYAALPTETGDNKGETIASLCDFLTEGSYVRFNSTHDIMCPIGPYRITRFSDSAITLTTKSQTTCKDLMTYDYPIIIEGESVIMKIVSCLNYY